MLEPIALGLATLALLLAGGLLSIVVHELAHAAAAKLLGGTPYCILIGQGKPWAQFRFLGMRWIVRGPPQGGFTGFALHGTRWFRLRAWLVIAAGPLTHVLWIALALCVWQLAEGATSGWPRIWLRSGSIGFAVLQAILLAYNVWPREWPSQYGTNPSDGMHLLKIPRMSVAELEEQLAGHRSTQLYFDCWRAFESHDHDQAHEYALQMPDSEKFRPVRELTLAIAEWPLRGVNASCERLAALLDDLEQDHELRPHVLNAMGWFLTITGQPEVLERAEAMAREALDHDPNDPGFVGTLGSVLVAKGELADGRRLLERARRVNPPFGRALNSCFLALADLQDGDHKGAAAHLGTAREIDPQCLLLGDVEARLRETAH